MEVINLTKAERDFISRLADMANEASETIFEPNDNTETARRVRNVLNACDTLIEAIEELEEVSV